MYKFDIGLPIIMFIVCRNSTTEPEEDLSQLGGVLVPFYESS